MIVNYFFCNYPKCHVRQRIVTISLLFIVLTLVFSMRMSKNMLLTDLVRGHGQNYAELPPKVKAVYCPREDTRTPAATFTDDLKNWTVSETTSISFCFYVGYVASHLPAGIAADRYGGRTMVIIAVITSAICSMCMPAVFYYADWVAMAFAFLTTGICQGLVVPSIFSISSKWIPRRERSFWGSLLLGATCLSKIVGKTITSYIVNQYKDWTIPFYFWAFLSFAYAALLTVWLYSDPENHPFITEKERDFLTSDYKGSEKDRNLCLWAYVATGKGDYRVVSLSKKSYKVPVKRIFTDGVIWTLALSEFGHGPMVMIFYEQLPKYMHLVLGLSVVQSYFFNLSSCISMFVVAVLSGLISDYILIRDVSRLLTLRRFMTLTGSIIPNIFLVVSVFVGCRKWVALSLLFVGLTCHGFYYSGAIIHCLDLSIHFAGTAQTIINGVGTSSNIIIPMVFNAFSYDNALKEFRVDFISTLILNVLVSIIYFIFIKDQRRPWDVVEGQSYVATTPELLYLDEAALDKLSEKKSEEEPAQEEPAQEEPAQEKPAQEEPAQEEPAQEKPAQEEPAQETEENKETDLNIS